MRATILTVLDSLRGSYWFLPTVMALGSIFLAGGMVYLNSIRGSEWMDGLPWLYAARPDGARQVLSAISGSMITVAGTVFSVTIAAVVYASGQYGPRLLSNFMDDRGNQVTLGTFIATFVYCLLVLRTIRSPEELAGAVGFVPNMALLVGVALALCSIAVLIFFIHHVPSKLHINSVIEDVGGRLLKEIDNQFPRFIGQSPSEHGLDDGDPSVGPLRQKLEDIDRSERGLIKAKATGYLALIDDDAVLHLARDNGLILRLQYQPGDFVHAGRALVEAWPPAQCGDDVERAIRAAFVVRSRRTALQDLRFLVDEIVEIAARALSPGVNDPFTAITCLDWLGAAFSELANRELPSHLRLDEDGALRVIAHPVTFERFMDRSFGALAQYCAGDMVAALRFLRALGEVSMSCADADRTAVLALHATRLEDLADARLVGFNRTRVAARAAELRRVLAEPDYRRKMRDTAAWLGGTA